MSGHISKFRIVWFLIFVSVFVFGKAASLEAAFVNINTAGVAELDTLPGIGPSYAQRIIDYRNANGLFQIIDDIQNVSGIGPATFANIKDLITVGPTDSGGSGLTDQTSTDTTSTNSSNSSSVSNYSSAGVTSYQSQSKLVVGIGKDRLGVTGSPIEFRVDSNIKLSRNSGVRWNFGDGTEAGGEVVTHAYEYPGEYVVVLNVDVSEGQAVARVNIKIIEPSLEITFADQGRIEIKNNSLEEVNLFGRILVWSDKYFAFPKDTIIKSGQSINFSKKVTGISPTSSLEVGLITLGGYANRKVVEKSLSEYKEQRALELRKEISLLESRKSALMQQNFVASAGVIDLATSTDEDLEEVDQTAIAIEAIPRTQESPGEGWFSVVKRFFLRNR